MSEQDLMDEASAELGCKHLAPAAGLAPWPVKGYLYGPFSRPLVCLPCFYKDNRPINVVFLVDTGAPTTEISPHAAEAMGFRGDLVGQGLKIHINGALRRVKVCEPNGNHPDIPILGADTMREMGLKMCVDYDYTVTLAPAPAALKVGMHCCDRGVAR